MLFRFNTVNKQKKSLLQLYSLCLENSITLPNLLLETCGSPNTFSVLHTCPRCCFAKYPNKRYNNRRWIKLLNGKECVRVTRLFGCLSRQQMCFFLTLVRKQTAWYIKELQWWQWQHSATGTLSKEGSCIWYFAPMFMPDWCFSAFQIHLTLSAWIVCNP